MSDESVLVSGGVVWAGGDSSPVFADLLIEGGVIAAIVAPGQASADITLDASGALVTPGFVNAHTHAGASPILRGLAEDEEVVEGGAFYHSTTPVRKLAFEILSPSELAVVVAWDTLAMLVGGATTIVNEQFGPAGQWIELVEKYGFRSSLGLTYPGNVGAIGYVNEGKLIKDSAPAIGDDFQSAIGLYDEYDGHFDGRLKVHFSVHGSDTVPEDILRETARVAGERNASVHMHLGQHEDELRSVQRMYSCSPIDLLERVGLLNERLLATHCTYLNDEELSRMAAKRAVLVHCSYRKAKEGHFSPFVSYLAKGGPVALATDSFDHDLIQDMRLAALLGKVSAGKVDAVNAKTLFDCITGGARKALPWSHLGTLAVGGAADLVVIPLDHPFGWPSLDPLRTAVYYARGGIRHSLVNGRPVVLDTEVVGVDAAELKRQVATVAQKVWSRAEEMGLLSMNVQVPHALPTSTDSTRS